VFAGFAALTLVSPVAIVGIVAISVSKFWSVVFRPMSSQS